MNVLELADKLYSQAIDYNSIYGKFEITSLREKAAAMLRQQQSEIKVSENLIRHLHAENKELRIENEQQQDELEALKKELHIAEEGYALLHKIHFKQGKK